jgi:hypothetical protein
MKALPRSHVRLQTGKAQSVRRVAVVVGMAFNTYGRIVSPVAGLVSVGGPRCEVNRHFWLPGRAWGQGSVRELGTRVRSGEQEGLVTRQRSEAELSSVNR